MKAKRILSFLIVFTMILSTLGTVGFAEGSGNVAKVGNTEYATIDEAIKEAAPNGTVEIIDDIVVDKWIMFSETLTIGNGNIITLSIDGLTIDGNNHTLTINSIESAGNGNRLFYDATNLNIKDLTIKCVDGVAGGIGLTSGVIENVVFDGGVTAIYPGNGDLTINNCTFATNGTAIYHEEERDNLKVTNNTFNQPAETNVILLRGNTVFTGNTINSGRTVNVVSGSPVVTGNNFNDVRFKVYNVAEATIEDNIINNLQFNDNSTVKSTFGENTLSEEAQAVLDNAVFAFDGSNINNLEDLKAFRDSVNSGDNYKGKTVVLNADIDLADEEWTPIGYLGKTFKGTFDGNGHTIKNLYINKGLDNAAENNGIGFFGRCDDTAVIKNLTIENADVQGSLYVGAVVGHGYTGKSIENCTVKGKIYIDAWWYAGAVGGNGYISIVNNCHVIGGENTNSYIKGNEGIYLGGIWGFRGEGDNKITNCTVENISITGVDRVGGISGIGHYGNTVATCGVDNVSIQATDPEATTVGLIVGACQGTADSPVVFNDNTIDNTTAKAGDVEVKGLYGTNINGTTAVTNYIATINTTPYETLEAAFTAALDGETITLLADATPTLTSQRAISKASVIDLGGKTLTLTEDDLYFGTTTFKNGTIVVDPSVKPSTAVFWMFKDQTLTFDNVKVIATGVTGTYLIGLDGNNSDLNLINGTEIVVENETALDLDIICVNSSIGNDILVENSKVNVKNLDGRVFFRGNYTVSGTSEIYLDGITKAGFRIEANQTLTIADTSSVTITGEPRDGGIHLTDESAVYEKADTATVNATVNIPAVSVAAIGDTKYTSLDDALTAAKVGETVTLLADFTGNININKSIVLDGNGKNVTGKISISADGATVKNLNVENTGNTAGVVNAKNVLIEKCNFKGQNGFRYCYTSGTVTFKDSTIVGSTYGIHFDGNEEGNIVIDNCQITGWTSFAGTIELITIKDTTFNEGNYNYIRFYQDAIIDGCTFNEKMSVDVANSVDATVKINNSTVVNGTVEDLFDKTDIGRCEVYVDDKLLANPVAKIGEEEFATLEEALSKAAEMTGDVTVEIYDKVTLNKSLSGAYSSINFVGKNEIAEIYLEVEGYITATGKNVAFTDLILSKSAGGFITNAGFMNVAFGIYDVPSVTYTNCTFANGAYASSGNNTFIKCTFKRSHDKYGLWAYGDADIVVDDCTFADYRGIKMYAEGAAKTTNLTVKNTDFSAVNDKPAIVLTYGESVVLENNTYSSTGVFELDLDGAPNGTPVTSDVTPTCKNDNGACGVLIDGKIYTTVAQAAEVATAESKVTLLHDSTETVEFPMGVTLDKNGYLAAGVTVKVPIVADMSVIYVDASWADKTVGTEVETGKIIGYNALANVSDVQNKITGDTTKIVIAAGEYSASGYVEMFKEGGLVIEGPSIGTAVLTSGNWLFGDNTTDGEYTVSGNFESKTGMIWFLGDKKNVTINVNNANMTSSGNMTFRGGKVVIDENSALSVKADASNWSQMMIYADVTCYGKINVDIVNPMGSAFLIGTDAYKNSYGYLYSKLTLVGEKASLTSNQKSSDGNSTVDIKVAGQGAMVVDGGATVNTNGYLMIAAQDAAALDPNGNKYGGVFELIDGTLNAANIINKGTLYLPSDFEVTGKIDSTAGTLFANGNLTFEGKNTVSVLNPGWYNHNVVIGSGDALTITGSRMTFSYGNIFDVTGKVDSALTTDKTTIEPSLNITQGISLNGNGLNAEMNIKDAYVILGDSTSKNSGATGTFNINIENSILDFTKTFKTYMPTADGLDPVFNINAKESIISSASHVELWNSKTNLKLDNSRFTVGGSFANAGVIDIDNGAYLTVNAPIMSSHGGNTGTININNGVMELKDSNEDWKNTGVINITKDGKLIIYDFASTGTITVDASGLAAGETVTVIEGNQEGKSLEGKITVLNGDDVTVTYGTDGDVTITKQEVVVEAPEGTLSKAYTSETGYWGECGGNAKESFEFKFYNNDTYMGYTKLNNIGGIINGNVYVSWNIKLDAESNTDEYWDMKWEIAPTIDMQANRVEQWVDGVKVAECAIEPNWSDSLFPVVATVTDENGKILSYVNNHLDATLENAIANGGNVVLLKDISLTNMITVPANTSVTLDLNGKTITGTDTTSKNFSIIDNRGELTVTGNGKITLTATIDSDWGRYSAVIANNPGGKLVIENGTIEHLGGTDMAYGIDNLTNGKGTYAETIVNGGTVKSTYRGIRQFLNGVEAENILTINGGTIEGTNKSIFFHDPSKNANTGTLTVSENATLNGDVYLFVTEGSTEWPVEVSIAASAVNGEVISANVPEGYEVENENGYYGVVEKTVVTESPFKDAPLFLAGLDDETVDGVTYHPLYIATSIDSLNYQKVGFDYTFTIFNPETNEVTFTAPYTTETSDVYTSISDSTTTYTVKSIGGNGAYLFMNKLWFDIEHYNNDNTKITITPYAYDMDGNKITGWTFEMTNEYYRTLQEQAGATTIVDMFKEGK